MFDGNHRVSRREVNLSGKRKNATKQTLLHESRQRREERRLAAQRAAAATRLQSRYRGIISRKQIFECRLEDIQQITAKSTRRTAEDTVTRILDSLVALSRVATVRANEVEKLLPMYASFLRDNSFDSAAPCARNIVDLALRHAKTLEFVDFEEILSYLLNLRAQENDIVMDEHLWSQRVSKSFDSIAIDLLCQTQTPSQEQTFLRRCIAQILPASIEKDAISFILAVVLDDVPHDGLQQQFEALQTLMAGNSSVHNRIYDIAVTLISKNAVKILSKAADLFLQNDPTLSGAASLVSLFHTSLMMNSTVADPADRALVLWAMNRVARGDGLEVVVEVGIAEQDDDDSDSDDEETTDNKATVGTTSRRLDREEFQTVAKLDRNFANLTRQVVQWYAGLLPRLQPEVERLADANLWHRLGVLILTDGTSHQKEHYVTLLGVILQSFTSSTANRDALSSQLLNKLSFSLEFMESLWSYIQSQNDSFLSPSFIASLSVFASVSSHYLVALRDETFIARHTDVKTAHSINEKRSIPIVEVLDLYNKVLCDLYLGTPVTQRDFKILLGKHNSDEPIEASLISTSESELSAIRAQAMLNGTKLWTSLYNRWSRLIVSAPFCDESTWWFDGAIKTDGAIRNEDSNDMDVDDDQNELADSFRDPKIARLLSAIPMVVPFDQRVQLFQSLLNHEKLESQNSLAEATMAIEAMIRGEEPRRSSQVKIHRDKLFEDSMEQLNALGTRMKHRIQVSFVNRHGAEEAGIDGGGVFREFIDDLINEAFLAENSSERPQLFSVTPHETLTINTDVEVSEMNLTRYEFLGRVLGKALYESILVEPQFCLPFLNQLLGKSNSLDDLKNLDAEYYNNLTKLLSMPVSDLEGLGLVFEANAGSTSVELVPNGKRTLVTKQNVISYVHLVANFKLNIETSKQTRAFLRGFRDLIPGTWLRLFSAHELQKLISGDDSLRGFDVDALKQSMQYAAGYHPDQPIIRWFWEVIGELSTEQKHQFLKFMTSCSRQPLLGFRSLVPAPCVQQIRLPDAWFQENDLQRIAKESPLPTSSTCMNLLKLPNYRSKELLKHKLLAAIESGAGFELT